MLDIWQNGPTLAPDLHTKRRHPQVKALAGLKGAAPSNERIAVSLDLDVSRIHPDTRLRTSAALRLLRELGRRAAETPDGAVVATLAELATTLGVVERSIQRARRDLAQAGLIEVEHGNHVPNTYRIVRH